MKKLLLLSLLVLAGCSLPSQQPPQSPVTVKIENSTGHPLTTTNDGQSYQSNGSAQISQATGYAVVPAYSVQDDYFGPAYGTVTEVQYIQQPGIAYETQSIQGQYQNQTQSAQNQIPAPMYAPQGSISGATASSSSTMQGGAVAPAGTQNQGVNPYYPYNAAGAGVQNPMGSGSVVVLQNPMTRELVRCDFTDYNCIGSYESQGYVQLRAAPHFAGYNDVPSATDYPPRRYRDNNNIPRW